MWMRKESIARVGELLGTDNGVRVRENIEESDESKEAVPIRKEVERGVERKEIQC